MQPAMQSPHLALTPVAGDTILHLRDELEAIARALSHDVQSPVRAIAACAEELSHGTGAPDPATLALLVSETARMKAQIQGMVDYIRLETFAPRLGPLEADELADAAIDALEGDIRRAGATVTRNALLRVNGHRGRLVRLFAHLIENALVFRGEAAPVIHISARMLSGHVEFSVRDNGIGIDEGQQDVIFRLFQRLHTAEAYPGHGIGLALARKIVEAHGGVIGVESSPGKGSVLRFTLPAATATES